MEAKIIGDSLPVVTCKLKKGEAVVTESGGMSWMDEGIKMNTSTNGGIMKGLGRALAGESLFMNTYTAEKDDVEIAFSSSFPGKILEFDLSEGETIIGEGFIMQKITGPGKVFLEIDGEVIKKELAEGEKLKIDNGYVAAMTKGVELSIETVPGLKNIMFGGEGLFLTTLKGPGTVWLQSMPISKLASLLYVPRG